MALIFKLKRFTYVIAMDAINLMLFIAPVSSIRLLILRAIGVKCGHRVEISRGIRLDFPWRLTIGENCYIGKNVYFDCRGGSIDIGDNTDISEGALIYTLSHDIQSENLGVKSGDVFISKRCWICVRAIVLPGTRLGVGNVLSANSVYSGISSNFSLLVGNPAKSVKLLNPNRANSVRNN